MAGLSGGAAGARIASTTAPASTATHRNATYQWCRNAKPANPVEESSHSKVSASGLGYLARLPVRRSPVVVGLLVFPLLKSQYGHADEPDPADDADREPLASWSPQLRALGIGWLPESRITPCGPPRPAAGRRAGSRPTPIAIGPSHGDPAASCARDQRCPIAWHRWSRPGAVSCSGQVVCLVDHPDLGMFESGQSVLPAKKVPRVYRAVCLLFFLARKLSITE